MDIKATVRHQFLQISPSVMLAEDSRNYMRMVFDFQTDDWDGTEKTAKFRNPKTEEVYESILDSTGACEIRWEATSDSGIMAVSVFGVNGDYRITTGIASVYLMPTLSGGESDTPPSPDVYQQLLTMLGQKADNMTYSDSVLKLLSGSKELASVIIAGGGSSVQPDWNQNDSGAADYIKNRPFYDDTNVLLEWDGNTEGLVAATDSDGTAMAYKIAEYADPDTFEGAMARLSNGEISATVIRSIPYYFDTISAVDAEAFTYDVVDRSVTYQGINYPEPGIYARSYTVPTETNYIAQLYVDAPVKLPNKYINLDTELSEESENPVQNKAIAEKFTEVASKSPYVVKTNSYDHILEVTDEELLNMFNSNIPLLGMFQTMDNCIYLPEIVTENGEKKIYFWPTYIDPNSPQNNGRMLHNRDLYPPDVDPYTRVIPLPINEEKGKVLTVGTGKNGEGIYSWQNLGALSGTTANSWADVPELLANYDTVLYNATYGNPPEGLRAPALIVAAATERGTRQLSILDGSGQIWTGSVNLSSGSITVKKVDAGIQALNLGAASDVDIRELEEGIYKIITDSGEINLNGFSGSVSGSGTPVTMATYSTNCLYLAVSREESSSGITIVVNVMDQAMPTQIVCEANGIGNYASWTSTKTDIKDICLSKDNTTEYTPTGDYNPATKKYVDDAVGGVSAATPRQQMQNTDTTVTLQPNTLYVFPEMATLTVTLATPANTNIANEYHFFFTSGATATVFSLAAADGSTIYTDAYSIDANMRYEVSVLDNVAYIKGVAMSEA